MESLVNKPMIMVGPSTRYVRCGFDVRKQPEYFRLIPGLNEDAHVHANNIVLYGLRSDDEDTTIILGIGYMYGAALFNAPPDAPEGGRVRVWDQDYLNDIIAPCVMVSACMEAVANVDIRLGDSIAMLTPYNDAPIARSTTRLVERLVERHASCLQDVVRGRDATAVPAPDVPLCADFVLNVLG
jgi:hypothetical protein